MKLLTVSAAFLIVVGLIVAGCSNENPVVAPVDNGDVAMATGDDRGDGSFTAEAKYTYWRSYAGGRALFLIRINPGPDFTGDATVQVSCDRLFKTEFTSTHLNAESPMTELKLYSSKQLELGFYDVTVTVSNQTHQETIQLEVEIFSWGILSMSNAVSARETFIDWLEVEHPELGGFSGQNWDVYMHYPLRIVEHYTHLNDQWEFRVGCHVTWIPQDYYEILWLRPRGEWDPILAAKRSWDEATQDFIIYETPLEDWLYYYGY